MPGLTGGGVMLPFPFDYEPLSETAQAIKNLADAMVEPAEEVLTTPVADLVLQAGWSAAIVRARNVGGNAFLWLDMVITRAAGAAVLTAGPANGGNIADTDMVKLPSRYTPARRQYMTGNRSSLAQWQVFLDTNGILTVSAGYPSATINPGDTLTIQGLVTLL